MRAIKLPKTSFQDVYTISHTNYPPSILVPVKQGSKNDAQIVVSGGHRVARGQVVCKGIPAGSQYHHSSIGGEVVKVRNMRLPGEYADIKSIEIKMGGAFPNAYIKNEDFSGIDGTWIMSALEESGIRDIDTGNVHSYLMRKSKLDFVSHIIINAVEFSPYLVLEEKILQMHAQEIAVAVDFIRKIFVEKLVSPKLLLCSNYYSNRRKFVYEAKKINIPTLSTHSISQINLNDENLLMRDNLDMIYSSLVKKMMASIENITDGVADMLEMRDMSIILRPSTLLAIYECIAFNKPYIDVYTQMTLNTDKIFIQRVPLGTPLTYLFSSFNKDWHQFPQHCFVGDFVNRKMLTNFGVPVTKHFTHFWFLSDSDFTQIYKKLNKRILGQTTQEET